MDKVMTFQKLLKRSILDLYALDKISSIDVFTGLGIALLLACFIFYIYKTTFRGVVYSYYYNVSLVLMCLLTTMVIMTVSSNIVLSLGMVGALSIVRFRTALKDPMDIVFMFWAIGVGIATGAQMYTISVIGSLFAGIVILVFARFNIKRSPYMLVIHYDERAHDEVRTVLNRLKYTLKSKTIAEDSIELTIEVKLKDDNTGFVNTLSSIEGVKDVVLVSYSGEYAS
ncbi:MAG: DUF4956 domain-containing protein [Chitinophagales bacterium]